MTEHTCGSCTACCQSTPVEEIGLRAYVRCPNLRSPDKGVGCSIYGHHPKSCRAWNCQWLVEPTWPDELRPDRSGLVVDILPDLCSVEGREMPAIQIWALPGHESDFEKSKLAADLVFSLFAAGYAVIWRMKGPEPGSQQSRLLWLDEHGIPQKSHTMPGGDPKSTLGTQRDRLRRAMELANPPE